MNTNMAQSVNLNQGWHFSLGPINPFPRDNTEPRTVNLPHDYMIESDVFAAAPSGPASGYYNAGVAHYVRQVEIPADWAGQLVSLRLDGAMMNATIEVNGNLAALQHYGYAPFEVDITRFVYFGQMNRVAITVNPSMQPNSRWYSGAGLFRGVILSHMPALRLAFGGLSAWTRKVEYTADGAPEVAYLQLSAELENHLAENRVAEVTFSLLREADGAEVLTRTAVTQVQPGAAATAYMTMTVDSPLLWSAETPNLYLLRAEVREVGTYRTHIIPIDAPTLDQETVLFGIRTVEADVRHGLRVNGQTVKLKGGCLHHDNGPIGAVSLYDAEARKVKLLKQVGFNAIRTTHNPPSAALIEACDRLGMYIFDEAFDVWNMGKQPGDYNQYFASDWEKDLSAFVRRDRCHPCVLLWSTGNEITERAGLGDGYVWAARLAETVHRLDPSRPVSNGVCSFWNGLDDQLMRQQIEKMQQDSGNLQNVDLGGKTDLLWEEYTQPFVNGMDIVGYNYLEGKYEQDHALFPERVILGSENFPVSIGRHWPVIEKTPWLVGDFTWTAWDYIGEAGIGKAMFHEPGDPAIGNPWGSGSPYPWRTANDADFDVTGAIRPQGVYRRIVWGSDETAVFAYDPANFGKVETLSSWGFPGVWPSWNWPGAEGQKTRVLVFSSAQEVELLLNGRSLGRKKAGDATVHDMPGTFLFECSYEPGTLEAVSFSDGGEVSRGKLQTAGRPCALCLQPETSGLKADGQSLCYVRVQVVDDQGHPVPDAALRLSAKAEGEAQLLGFGSGNPVTDENYTAGSFTTWQGQALAVLRAGYQPGTVKLTVQAETLPGVEISLPVTP